MLEVSAAQSPSLRLQREYVNLTFEYIKLMNKATDDRANYLIVGNSVVFAGVGSLSLKDLPGVWSLALIPTLLLLATSIAFSISAILPKTLDPDIPIGTSGISRMTLQHYLA